MTPYWEARFLKTVKGFFFGLGVLIGLVEIALRWGTGPAIAIALVYYLT